jgi:two-component system sensor histidine kinase/response regulator
MVMTLAWGARESPITLGGRVEHSDTGDDLERETTNQETQETREAVSWTRSDFLASMSHEIRTPLNGVIGMAELLLETDLTSKQQAYIKTVLQSGEQLLSVIEDIFDFSKIEAGLMCIEPEDFELRMMLKEVSEPFFGLADDKGLSLGYSVGHDVPEVLSGDPIRLRQILANLVGNAVRSTEEGEVLLRSVLIEDSDETAVVRFEVIDTRTGVETGQEDLLFRPFSQIGVSTAHGYGGTGLGLAISRRLVEMMGGRIGVESEPGEGSILWFEVPLQKRPEGLEASPAPRFDLRNLRVLIVGNDLTSQELLHEQTTSWGMQATSVEDGPRALELLRDAAETEEPYDLVLLDTALSGMSALDLARAIKADPATSAVQLVLLSSLNRENLSGEAQRAGIATLMIKPVPQARLYESLKEVMSAKPRAPLMPLHTEEEPAVPRRDPEETIDRPPSHLLVAEDNPANQLVAVRMLENLGYTSDVVVNGREAVEALSRTPYTAVLMDIQMPVWDGYEATAEIRNREGSTRHTPIIAMTANAMQGDRERCLAAGMDDYISKPVKLHDLERVLMRWTSVMDPAPDTAPPDMSKPEGLRELHQEDEPEVLS